MPNPTEGCFVGSMPPQSFLDSFLDDAREFGPTPQADFSKVDPYTNNMHDMCTPFIRAVKKSRLMPSLRLFVARAKRRWYRTNSQATVQRPGEVSEGETVPDLFPAMSARQRPRTRGQNQSTNIAEYYSFATSLLGIEVRQSPASDPFADSVDYESSAGSPSVSSPGSATYSSPLTRAEEEPASHSIHEPPTSPSLHAGPPPDLDLHEHTPRQHHSRRRVSHASSDAPLRFPVERETEEGTTFRRSLVAHAHAQFARQHRTCFFQIILVNRWARFVRWDRSGAIVTSRFDYVDEPGALCEFLWRFGYSSDSGRGLDPTTTPANKSEVRLFEGAVRDFLDAMKAGIKGGRPVRRLPGAEDTLDCSDTYPTWKIHVTNEETNATSDLIVRRPFTKHSSLFGRATRAYIAYDMREQRLVCLKDAWRIDRTELQPEFTTYKHLKEHDVPHVPAIWYGGDVLAVSGEPQKTLSQIFALSDEPWRRNEGSFEKHVHHRLVQDLAYPLECALDEREFIQAIHDGLCAITSAFDSAEMLHRDLSMGNIMLDSLGRGILNDWDHAGSKHSKACGIGTWRFMSLQLLENPQTKVHDIMDDLESVFWVLLYVSLKRFTRHADRDRLIQERLMKWFDYHSVDPEDGRQVGGLLKEDCLLGGSIQTLQFTSDSLGELIQTSRKAWFAYYTITQKSLDLEAIPELKVTLTNQYEWAQQPSFWIDLFAQALQDIDSRRLSAPRAPVQNPGESCSADVIPQKASTGDRSSKQSSKRKAGINEKDFHLGAGADDHLPLRRSKRLRVSRV